LRGNVSVSLFPSGSASFTDVVLSGDGSGRPPLAAERLTAQLRFLPLLLGRIEVAEVTLVRPQILISIDPAGRSNWEGLLTRLAGTQKRVGGAQTPVSFSEIRLVSGIILIQDAVRARSEILDGVELSLAWPSISKSFGATGQFFWRGEKVQASASLSDFTAALAGERSGLKVRMSGAPLKLAFDGHVGHKPTLKIEGTLAADSPSLRKALQWAGQEPLPGGGFGRFALKAQTNVIGSSVALSSVNVELDGNAAEGVLSFTTDGRLLLQGTLAADEIDVTPYISSTRLLGANDRDWSQVPIRLEGLSGMEFDLRLSAARIRIGVTEIGRTALAANLRGGRFVLTIGESQAFGGLLKGAIALAKSERGADLKAQLQFTDVDLDACSNALFGVRRLEGRGNIALAIEADGNDMLALTRSANGAGSLGAINGAVTGINVEQLLRRLERRPLSGAGDFRSGRTPFERLVVMVKIVDGIASIDDVKLESSAVRLGLAGSASIPARDLDLKGIATLAGVAAKDNGPGFELPFVVRGRWDDPVMLPDAQSLIRRSGAAAPLLDAVRGGRARDAVRSAIDQLTRGAEPPQAVSPAAEVLAPAAAAQ
jgi:AsmA protein